MINNTITVSVHSFNDDAEYKDYDLHVDNIGGFDWKLSFYLDKESGEWTGLEAQKSLPGEPYYECGGEEVPSEVMASAEAKRLEIITGTAA